MSDIADWLGPWEVDGPLTGPPGGPRSLQAGVAQWTTPAEFIASVRTDAPKAYAALRAVLEVHEPRGYLNRHGETVYDQCKECYGDDYPCPTVEAIRTALGVDHGRH